MNWIFITASFGTDTYHDAARRLLDQAKSFGVFSKYVHLTVENLDEYAPETIAKYKRHLNSRVRGYGFYSWKAEAVKTILKKNPRAGVLYLDSGCEFNNNSISKIRLSAILRSARRGHFFYTLNYPELLYTKRRTLDYFGLTPTQRMSSQFQATWFALSGQLGLSIAEKWSNGILGGLELIDDSIEREDSNFIEHRHDQSILSCTLKTMGIRSRKYKPCSRPETLLSSLNCYFQPIWSARNRSGNSIINSRRDR